MIYFMSQEKYDAEIKRLRSVIQKNHPDKGGNAEEFQAAKRRLDDMKRNPARYMAELSGKRPAGRFEPSSDMFKPAPPRGYARTRPFHKPIFNDGWWNARIVEISTHNGAAFFADINIKLVFFCHNDEQSLIVKKTVPLNGDPDKTPLGIQRFIARLFRAAHVNDFNELIKTPVPKGFQVKLETAQTDKGVSYINVVNFRNVLD